MRAFWLALALAGGLLLLGAAQVYADPLAVCSGGTAVLLDIPQARLETAGGAVRDKLAAGAGAVDGVGYPVELTGPRGVLTQRWALGSFPVPCPIEPVPRLPAPTVVDS